MTERLEVTSEPNGEGNKGYARCFKCEVVADAGYSNGTAAAACEADDITACVPTNRSIHSQNGGTMFGRSAFVYKPEADTYICPAGHVLARKQEVLRRDRLILFCGTRLHWLLTQAALHDRRTSLCQSPSA